MPCSSVLSMVPRQLNSFDEKLAWLWEVVRQHDVDLVITPQEFFGGAYIMPDRKWFTKEELLPLLSELCITTKTGMVVGVCEKRTGGNVESLWFINHQGELQGTVEKMALPKYDHVATNGYGRLISETDISRRCACFSVGGLEVAGIFCWEVYSTVLWAAISVAKPDLVANCIKFGVNSWPQVRKNPRTKRNEIEGFGYGTWSEDGGWIERLKIASLWETRSPITTSTNSWGLRPISMPVCGTWCGLDGQGPRSLWHPTKEDKLKEIPEKLIVDEIDRDKVRGVRQNKWAYKEAVGEFPPMSNAKYTMLLKMARIEDRVLSGREASSFKKQRRGFGLCQG